MRSESPGSVAVGLVQLALIAGLVLFVVRGCDLAPAPVPPDPDDGHVQVLPPAKAADASVRVYRRLLRDVYLDAEAEIAAGRVTSDTELLKFTERTKEARERAFATFDAAAEASIPDGKWDTPEKVRQARKFCRDAAAGFGD